VFAEGDELPGLVIDFYNGVAVIQCHSVGMHNIIQDISQILQDIYKEKIIAIYDKSQNSLPTMNNNTYENKFLYGNIPNTTILENDFKFIVDFIEGQKTGFFIDQRENRTLIKNYSKDRKVLNLFSYTGAFSIYAAGSGAKFIYSVDSSAKAIDMAKKNMEINGFSTVSEEIQTDVMEYLQNTNEKYDLIILDPPAFAKHNDARHNAIQGYTRLNAEAIKKLNHNGILFTFSCSQLVDRQLFNSAVMAAAIQSERKIKILHQLSQPPDHPYSIFHPEGHYLKGLVLMAN